MSPGPVYFYRKPCEKRSGKSQGSMTPFYHFKDAGHIQTQYRDAYIATEEDDLDLTYFLVYTIRCIRKAREKLIEHLHNERERTSRADRLIAALPNLTKRQGQILRYVLEYKEEEFGIREIAERFSIAYQTARTDLMHLEDSQYLWMKKKGKAQYYIVDEGWLASVRESMM